jgi:hypothetical protein
MSGFDENSERRVLPLWRSAYSAAKSSELQPLPSTQVAPATFALSPSDLDDLLKDFSTNPSIGVAADAINSAVLSDRMEDAREPAAFILKSSHIPVTLRKLAQKIIGEVCEERPELDLAEKSRPNIKRLRHLLKIDPRSSVLLVDLAREYASVGKLKAADRAIQTALTYGGKDRWVSRMAARFYVHSDKKDKAHYLIANHPLVRSDPWMLAAEIAIAQAHGKGPTHWKRAKQLLEGSLPPAHLSELACAVGTLEMESGTNRRARKYFAQALVKPTENSLAQLKWAERHLKTNFETDQHLGHDHNVNAFEANFWASYYRGDLINAREFASKWLAQEPFSKRPATMLSFLFELLDDHQLGLEAANWGLRANPSDNTLRLNKYFAEISAGWDGESDIQIMDKQDRIEKDLVALVYNQEESQHALANLGLLYYRQGRHLDGREAYDLATSTQIKHHNELSAAAAKVFHAREAVIHRCEWASDVLADAKSTIEKAASPGLRFYLAKIETAFKHPEQVAQIFSKTSEENNPITSAIETEPEKKVEKLDFEITKSGATIWLPAPSNKGRKH